MTPTASPTPSSYKSTTRVVSPLAYGLMGNLYESPLHVLDEYVDNGADAGATLIVVYLDKDRIVISDNGLGMVMDMLPSDMETVNMFMEDIEAGKYSGGLDIRELISPVSKASLRWMMECIAFSSKTNTAGTKIRGKRGIGAIAWRQIGNHAVFLTRPIAELAEAFYGSADLRSAHPPVGKLVPPSAEALERFDMSYVVEESKAQLVDVQGNVLSSGTTVEITDLKPGVENSLRYSAVLEHFGSVFGEDIRSGRLKILVVSGTGKSARQAHVTPTPYPGTFLLEETLTLKGKSPFKIVLHYDPKSRGAGLKLRHKDRDIRPLSELDEFKHAPWNTDLAGFIEFPDVDEKIAPWSTDKRTPLSSPTRNQWQKEVKEQLEERIRELIQQILERAREERSRHVTSVVSQALTETLKELPSLQDIGITPDNQRSERKTRTTRPKQVLTRVLTTVFDEHQRGIEGVTIELHSRRPKDTVIATHQTSKYGKISFGTVDPGRYYLRIIVPSGMTNRDINDFPFELTMEKPGIWVPFVLETGLPKKDEPKIPQIKFSLQPMSNPDQPYSIDRLRSGVLEINSEATDMRQALDTGNDETQALLLSLYAAQAIGEIFLHGDPTLVNGQVAHLFVRSLERTREGLRTKR